MTYIPVIRTITDSYGKRLEPADELRIMPGLTARQITGYGPDRIELAPSFLTEVEVPQPTLAATGNVTQILALATDRLRIFRGVNIFVTEAVNANNANYRKVTIVDVTSAGDPLPLFQATTKFAPVGTGSWVAFVPPFTVPAFDLPAGHHLVASWESSAGGVVIPSGMWQLLQ